MSLPRRQALRLGAAAAWGTLAALATVPTVATAQATSFERGDWPVQRPTPPLDVLDMSGQRVRLVDFAGRVLVLNFWASWCEPCRAEMPTLQQLPAILGEDRVAVLALNFKEGPRRIAQFTRAAGVTLPVALDPQGEVARAWEVKVFPTTALIDPQGRARMRIRGEVDWSSPQALGWIDALMRR